MGCHNRLAKAYLELSKYRDARASLKAALASAVNDALSPLGISIATLPMRIPFIVGLQMNWDY
ncbi:MAG TPA: hypothetical protein EYO82_02485 [Gammaproteobacteria bacterium]|nr:hypothetical protein [Gammaproteobacteria bacterium]